MKQNTKTITLTAEEITNITSTLREGIRWCRYRCSNAYDQDGKPIADKMDEATAALGDALDAWNTFAEKTGN